MIMRRPANMCRGRLEWGRATDTSSSYVQVLKSKLLAGPSGDVQRPGHQPAHGNQGADRYTFVGYTVTFLFYF
jgi:hypothetical protein